LAKDLSAGGFGVGILLQCTIEKDMPEWLYYIYHIIIFGPVRHAEIVEEDPMCDLGFLKGQSKILLLTLLIIMYRYFVLLWLN